MKYIKNKGYDAFEVKYEIKEKTVKVETQGKMGALTEQINMKKQLIVKNKTVYCQSHTDSRVIMGKIKKNMQSVISGHYGELQLIGLGFAVYRVNDTLVFDVGYSHYISYVIEKDIVIKLEGQNLILYSIYHERLKTFISNLKRIKELNIYKGTGLVNKNEKIKLKKGKTR